MTASLLLVLIAAITEGAKLPLSPSFSHIHPSFVQPLDVPLQTTALPVAPARDDSESPPEQQLDVSAQDSFDRFIPGVIFKPPVFRPSEHDIPLSDSFDIQFLPVERDFAPIAQGSCAPQTSTAISVITSVVPSTIISFRSVFVTKTIPVTAHTIVTDVVTQTIVDRSSRTHHVTDYVTVQEFVTVRESQPAQVIVSTSTTYVPTTAVVRRTSVITDLVKVVSTKFITTTITSHYTSVVQVSVTQTLVQTLPPATSFYVSSITSTLPQQRLIDPQIEYATRTAFITETVTATQFLKPETIERTTSIIVPSYSTVTSTHNEIRTKTEFLDITSTSTVSFITYSTVTRYGLSESIKYTQVTLTNTQVQYTTTTVPQYVKVQVTKESPIFVTITSTKILPSNIYITKPGNTITTYITQVSVHAQVTTVTDYQRTPVVYVTTTVAVNCSKK